MNVNDMTIYDTSLDISRCLKNSMKMQQMETIMDSSLRVFLGISDLLYKLRLRICSI